MLIHCLPEKEERKNYVKLSWIIRLPLTENYRSYWNYNHDGNLGQKNGGSFVAAHFPRWQRGKDVITLHERQLKPRSNDDVQSRQRSKGRNTTSPFPSSYLNRFYKAWSLRNPRVHEEERRRGEEEKGHGSTLPIGKELPIMAAINLEIFRVTRLSNR